MTVLLARNTRGEACCRCGGVHAYATLGCKAVLFDDRDVAARWGEPVELRDTPLLLSDATPVYPSPAFSAYERDVDAAGALA